MITDKYSCSHYVNLIIYQKNTVFPRNVSERKKLLAWKKNQNRSLASLQYLM